MKRRVKAKKLVEDAAAATAVPPSAQPNNNNNAEQQNTEETDATTNGEADQNQVPFTADDVAKMTAGEVINYVYVNPPQNLDPQTKNALLDRADQMRKEAESNGNIKDRAKEILRSVGMSLEL